MANRISRPTKSSYLLLSAVCFGAAAGLVFAYSILPRFSSTWLFFVLLIVFGVVCLGPVWLGWRQGKLDLFEPPTTMSLLYFFLFGVCSIPYVTGRVGQQQVHGLPVDIEWMIRALFYLIFGMLALWLGYRSRVALWLERRLGIVSSDCSSSDRRTEIPVSWIVGLWLAGWTVRAYLLRLGIAGYLKAQYREVASAHLGSAQFMGLVGDFARYALILALLALLTTHKYKFGAALTFGMVLSTELIVNIVSGYRAFALWTFMYMAVAYYYARRRFPKGVVITGILVFLFIFALIPLYRHAINKRQLDVRDTLSVLSLLVSLPATLADDDSSFVPVTVAVRGAERFFLSAGRLEHMATAVLWADRFGTFPYKYDILLLPVLAFVPRFLWPSKPVRDMGLWFYREVQGGTALNASAMTYPGALYLAYGFWGFLIAMWLTGILQRFTYRRYAHSESLSVIFLAPFLWRLLLLDSDFVGALVGFIRQLIVLLIIRRLVFGRSAPRRDTEATVARSSASIGVSAIKPQGDVS